MKGLQAKLSTRLPMCSNDNIVGSAVLSAELKTVRYHFFYSTPSVGILNFKMAAKIEDFSPFFSTRGKYAILYNMLSSFMDCLHAYQRTAKDSAAFQNF